MRYMPIAKVDAGMVLGQGILDREGEVMLAKGTLLGQEETRSLVDMGVSGIYIEDAASSGLEALRLVYDLFQEGDAPEVGQDDIIDVARRMTKELLAGRGLLYNRMDIRAADDYTFFHAVNVAALSVMLGIQTENLDLEELTMLPGLCMTWAGVMWRRPS